jgi:hypothetical protein
MVLEPGPSGRERRAGARAERGVVANIADNQREKGRWRRIRGVVEPTASDCCCDDGAPWDAKVACDGFGPAPLPEVLAWAGGYTGHVTLYLYDHEPFEGTDAEQGGQ